MSDSTEPRASDFVQSLARGFAVIRAFDAEHPALNLSEVAKRAEISPASARRFLYTLEQMGYVRADGRQFTLAPRVLELGFSYLSALSLPEVMQPHLERLSRAVGESVSGAVLTDGDIVYIARVPTRRIMSIGITIGTSFPAHATSMGRVLLASLDEQDARARVGEGPLRSFTNDTVTEVDALLTQLAQVRQQGWAIVDGELETELRSLAVPVNDKDGTVAAAINISTTVTRHSVERMREVLLPQALDTARDIEAELKLL
ncbi:IclR family transcriptional regulator domain-containing protein [Gulosibacter molinativorax]|uniref:IclR family transcriptional regulator n=1 Tax=Gulosibacter molinativorax TaxID=256821 RepID=A0ABT7C6M9_9MICO|nr:IclR family transcriptional regulator C-terminal domain-containing protein [Gulosibacter molinativorax]MDJ1370866.1 IclR family transcriptional regulator [Gulosibacter molinativorax]QUY62203.1 Pca regulon regulatory protein [Gulosibacter molinativorax]